METDSENNRNCRTRHLYPYAVGKERTLTELSTIETALTNVLDHKFTFEVENRIQEKIDNETMLDGYKLIIGALCALLASLELPMYFPIHWDLSGKGKESLRDICPSA